MIEKKKEEPRASNADIPENKGTVNVGNLAAMFGGGGGIRNTMPVQKSKTFTESKTKAPNPFEKMIAAKKEEETKNEAPKRASIATKAPAAKPELEKVAKNPFAKVKEPKIAEKKAPEPSFGQAGAKNAKLIESDESDDDPGAQVQTGSKLQAMVAKQAPVVAKAPVPGKNKRRGSSSSENESSNSDSDDKPTRPPPVAKAAPVVAPTPVAAQAQPQKAEEPAAKKVTYAKDSSSENESSDNDSDDSGPARPPPVVKPKEEPKPASAPASKPAPSSPAPQKVDRCISMSATPDGKVNFETNDLSMKTDEIKTLAMIALQNKGQAIKFQIYINNKKCIGVKSLKDLNVSNQFQVEVKE